MSRDPQCLLVVMYFLYMKYIYIFSIEDNVNDNGYDYGERPQSRNLLYSYSVESLWGNFNKEETIKGSDWVRLCFLLFSAAPSVLT